MKDDNKRKRNVFLFGAGATLNWGSPLTSELTNLILDTGFKIKGNEVTITRFIYNTLVENGYNTWDVNFETIINVVEELIVYYGKFNYNDFYENEKLPSLTKCFFENRYEDTLLNYSIKGGVVKHGYQLMIPEGVEYYMANHAYHDEPPQQFFFEHLLNELLSCISTRITEYSYHTSGHSDIDHTTEMSLLFIKWMRQKRERGILRMYTLNYERLFKILLEKAGISVFEGFDCEEFIDYNVKLRANVPRILSDYDRDIHYNLHGSAFWEVLDLDHAQLPNPEIVLVAFPHLQVNNCPSSYQVEKGKTLMVTNLITGYQKAQKGMITPFKQMQAAFDRDCCFADHIYIIGYSLGDEHINESIKTALRHNPQIKITIVDPFFIKNKKDLEIAIKYYPFKQLTNLLPTNVDDNRIYSYLEGALVVYNVGFEDFLRMQTDITFKFRYHRLNDDN
jgi:hypothetical protein